MTIEIGSTAVAPLIVDLSNENITPRNANASISSTALGVPTISARNVVIKINSILDLSGVSIPAQGEGYLTVWADVSQENGEYRRRIKISAVDLTPAGPGRHTVEKVLENIPPGKYRVYFDFMSYWRHGGGFKYSTYAHIQGDGEKKWGYDLVAAPGQADPRYESSTVFIEVI